MAGAIAGSSGEESTKVRLNFAPKWSTERHTHYGFPVPTDGLSRYCFWHENTTIGIRMLMWALGYPFGLSNVIVGHEIAPFGHRMPYLSIRMPYLSIRMLVWALVPPWAWLVMALEMLTLALSPRPDHQAQYDPYFQHSRTDHRSDRSN